MPKGDVGWHDWVPGIPMERGADGRWYQTIDGRPRPIPWAQAELVNELQAEGYTPQEIKDWMSFI